MVWQSTISQTRFQQHMIIILFVSLETFLDSSISNGDERINIEGYNLLWSDHPSNKERGGVCMYYKEHLPFIKRDDLCTLKEC